MKKYLHLCVAATLLSAASATAGEEVIIAGLTITDALAGQGNLVPVLNAMSGVTATGSITYDTETCTLTLTEASVATSNEAPALSFSESATNVTVRCTGANTLKNTNVGYVDAVAMPDVETFALTLTGPGTLDLSSYQSQPLFCPNGSLTIDNLTLSATYETGFNYGIGSNNTGGCVLVIRNSDVTAVTISRLKSIEFVDCEITMPASYAIEYAVDGYPNLGVAVWQIAYDGTLSGIARPVVVSRTSAGVAAPRAETPRSAVGTRYGLDGRPRPAGSGIVVEGRRKVLQR